MTDLERIDIANMIGLVIVQLRLRSATYDQAVEQLGYIQFRMDHPNWHGGMAPEANLMGAVND